MKVQNMYEFEVEYFSKCHSVEKVLVLTPEETANLYRWTYQMPLSAPVDLDALTENELEEMQEELAYQFLYCAIGDSAVTFDASLLPEWIIDRWGK